MKTETLYWVWLSCRLGVANRDFPRLMLKYESPYDIYTASPEELCSVDGIGRATVECLSNKSLDIPSNIMEFCAKTDVRVMPYSSELYPNRLRLLPAPPVLLYVRGTMPQMDHRVCIAVVGTRRMSEYGRDCAYKIAYELGAANAVTVSGLALGIDGVAACGAIRGGGDTVAVLGCGIDIIYPKAHAKLTGIIAENGAVVTEYPPGTPPIGEHFPIRNRIISGMCQGTLVVEADERSGAIITAHEAMSQGRQVFAIPGNLGEENTSGTNALIRDGAIMIMETDDILREYRKLYDKYIDLPRLAAARRRYSFSEESLDNMGVSARYARESRPVHSNEPSAPRASFDRKKSGASSTSYVHEHKKNAPVKTVKTPTPTVKATGDHSAEVLASLDEKYRALFAEIPDDRAVTADALAKLGYSIGEVMTAMTMLELKGLVSSLPGGLYIKR
ncbi:MAG: DNA-processing protein DprA [Clostridia bacterium]|nr:DNA-processing protein DprA [Clostridia bacterium]